MITCSRNGVERIVGTSTYDREGLSAFIDYTTKDFIGQVKYYATPVSITGKVGNKVLVGETILLENFPSSKVSLRRLVNA